MVRFSTTLGISRSAIQKQVDNLAEKGYITRPMAKTRLEYNYKKLNRGINNREWTVSSARSRLSDR